MSIKSAEIWWNPVVFQLQYRCAFCELTFSKHADCITHVVFPCRDSPHPAAPAEEPCNDPHSNDPLFPLSDDDLPNGFDYDSAETSADCERLQTDKSAESLDTANSRPTAKPIEPARNVPHPLTDQHPPPIEPQPPRLGPFARGTKPKRFTCEVCGKQMADYSNLLVHKRIHTGERPYRCTWPQCDRSFTSSTERKSHLRRHAGDKPFQCCECPTRFTNASDRKKHMDSKHSSVRPYRCDQCDRTFRRRGQWKVHRLSHTGEKPHVCAVCGMAFRQQSAWKVHMHIHSDHRPYKCSQCERGFHSSAARRSHEKIFHKIA